jgi:hypothetical protein
LKQFVNPIEERRVMVLLFQIGFWFAVFLSAWAAISILLLTSIVATAPQFLDVVDERFELT